MDSALAMISLTVQRCGRRCHRRRRRAARRRLEHLRRAGRRTAPRAAQRQLLAGRRLARHAGQAGGADGGGGGRLPRVAARLRDEGGRAVARPKVGAGNVVGVLQFLRGGEQRRGTVSLSVLDV